MTSSEMLRKIVRNLQEANFAEAETLCLDLTFSEPTNFDAHYFLGVARERQGRFEEALSSLRTASELNPRSIDAWQARGMLLAKLARHQEALVCYDRAFAMNARSIRACNGRALALHELGRTGEAIESYTQALRIEPKNSMILCNLGTIQLEQGLFVDALRSFDAALAIQRKQPQAMNGRANALRGLGRWIDALGAYDELLDNFPDSAEGYCNRGIVLKLLNRFEEGLRSFDAATRLRPGFAQAWSNRGNLLYELGRLGEALSSLDAAIRANPAYPEALNNRGRVLRATGLVDQALDSYDRALELAPDFSEASVNKALCLLLTGNFEQGWALYERRRKPPPRTLDRDVKLWDGQTSLEGKSVLLCAEQGLGDTIQFSRYAKVLEEKGARPILAVPRALVRLLEGLTADVEILDQDRPLPATDFYIPLMSAPFACGTKLENIPSRGRYLAPEDGLVEIWKKKIGEEGFKIGIHWQGNRQAADDRFRSIPLDHFERLSRLEGVRLISLQKGDGFEQLNQIPWAEQIETLGGEFDAGADAFVDTAAVIANLDLVITSDTSIAHLVGALGRPTWLVLPHSADWRWLMHRSDSPWYSSMRIFRQSFAGDWNAPFSTMIAELSRIAQG